MQNEPNQNPPADSNEYSINPTARHNARRCALQALYQRHLAETPLSDIETEFLRYHVTKKLDIAYFKELIHEVTKHQHEIDTTMQPFLARSLNEIDPIELSVLRLAIYELMKRPDVPYRVIINEALELSKKFGSVEGYKFVNSILDRVAKKTRSIEIESSKGKKG